MTLWLIQQRKERNPKHIELTTYELRHNKSYWLTADQLQHYGKRARVNAQLTGQELVIKTDNVGAFTVGPIAAARSSSVRIDGQPLTMSPRGLISRPEVKLAPGKSIVADLPSLSR